MGRFLRKLEGGQVTFGSIDSIGSRTLTEVIAFAGLDALVVDTMFCSMDWELIATLGRSARLYDLDSMVRIPSFPWIGGTDRRMAVDAARAFGVGAVGVVFSCTTAEEVQQVVEVSQNWHRDIHIHPFTREDFAQYERRVAQESVAMPLIESLDALENLEAILAVDGVKTVWMAMTDLSRVLGHPFDYEHPEVTKALDRALALARNRGVALGANVGYEFSRSLDEMSARVGRMVAQGFRSIWFQNTGFLIQWFYRGLLERVAAHADAPEGRSQQKSARHHEARG